ncbi:hypothetical protein C0Q70_00591 [Pomacea canaliculata]|uniref:Armadillo repeat-containing protein 8 n=1 Tax=Pomacea canaliculata TaxID=400727 RepID=A0A2T7PX58_POMCA|nr:hypothetical protein C0Q70_00591 [Pomacea canaliculata]
MECDDEQSPIDIILGQEQNRWMESIVCVKNLVIGNNRQKSLVIQQGIVPRLLQWMIDESIPLELRTEAAVVLGSLAKGTEENIQQLVNAGAVPTLLKGLFNNSLPYVEACLRCLRTIFLSSHPPVSVVYQDATIIPHFINIISRSICTKECIANVLANCCTCTEHQNILCANGAIQALASLLTCNIYKIQMPALKSFAVLSFNNEDTCKAIASATFNGEQISSLFGQLLAHDKTSEMQMAAAKCLTYLYRGGAIPPTDRLVSHKALPTLVRMCKKDRTLEENVEGAETLSYLIEMDPELQKIASISDHIIKALAEYLKYTDIQQLDSSQTQKKDVDWSNALKQAAFQAFASLGANDEDIRKRVIETEHLIEHIITGMNSDNPKVQIAATRCLHSLSRSVQQLRTTFQDHAVWRPLLKLMQSDSDQVLTIASSTLCNLLLEFSPSKEAILECGAIKILVDLTAKPDPALRLNGVWGLMNLTFQAELKTKAEIIETLGSEQLFDLLSDSDSNILVRTLGLLRNILTKKSHIDSIMYDHGNEVMQAVVYVLEGEHTPEIKEQILCILANIADGNTSKDFIMKNDDVLKKIISYMVHANVNLQIAAVLIVSNLLTGEDDGAYMRQARLRELGMQRLLQQLLTAENPSLFQRYQD